MADKNKAPDTEQEEPQGDQGGGNQESPGTDTSTPAAAPATPGPAEPAEDPADTQHAGDGDNQLPKTGAEGGIVEQGTGAFAPEATGAPDEAREGYTLVTDGFGHTFETLAGADGENPVSPQNPSRKAARA